MATTGCGRVGTARALSCKQFVDPAPAAEFGSCRLAPCCGDGWRCLRRGLPVTDTAIWCAREEPDSAGEGWAGGNHGCWPLMDRVDDLGVVDPTQVRRGDAEVGMPELALYNQQRDTLARHLHSLRMSQLVGCEPAPNSGGQGGPMQLGTDAGRRAWPPAGRAAQNAEERADRQGSAQLEPRIELLLIPTSE
jgi:hypothetical protein